MGAASIPREGDDAVAALGIDLHVAAGRHHDVLLAADDIGRRRRVDAGAGLELPQYVAALGVIGLEPAVAFAGEDQAAGRGENAADHRLRRLHLPFDLAGVVVDCSYVAPLLFRGDDLEGAAEPQLAL